MNNQITQETPAAVTFNAKKDKGSFVCSTTFKKKISFKVIPSDSLENSTHDKIFKTLVQDNDTKKLKFNCEKTTPSFKKVKDVDSPKFELSSRKMESASTFSVNSLEEQEEDQMLRKGLSTVRAKPTCNSEIRHRHEKIKLRKQKLLHKQDHNSLETRVDPNFKLHQLNFKTNEYLKLKKSHSSNEDSHPNLRLNLSLKSSNKKYGKSKHKDFKTGRWTHDEHKRFIEALLNYGNEWKEVQRHVGSRSSAQARSHAQKFFLKLKKANIFKLNTSKNSIRSLNELIHSNEYSDVLNILTNFAFEKVKSNYSNNLIENNLNISESLKNKCYMYDSDHCNDEQDEDDLSIRKNLNEDSILNKSFYESDFSETEFYFDNCCFEILLYDDLDNCLFNFADIDNKLNNYKPKNSQKRNKSYPNMKMTNTFLKKKHYKQRSLISKPSNMESQKDLSTISKNLLDIEEDFKSNFIFFDSMNETADDDDLNYLIHVPKIIGEKRQMFGEKKEIDFFYSQ